jgi:orotate phosphoribosyltransferase
VKATAVDRAVDLLVRSGALLRGHFRLTSGLHSDEYCQCARVLEDPKAAEELGKMLAELFEDEKIDSVISPAIGGIIIGHEVARALGVRSIFAERGKEGMTLRRGFSIEPGERLLIVEDVVTTGGSVREVATLVQSAGADIAGFAFVVDRSRNPLGLPGKVRALLERRSMEVYSPEECPLCEAGVPIEKPGSRPE